MYLLDTDHLSILERSGKDSQPLLARLSIINPNEVVATTIVTYEEQTRGWLSYMAASRSLEAQVEAYRQLQQHLANFCAIPVIGFESAAASTFKSLKNTYPRLGSMDLKIAAIAIANNATLLTRNLSDFSQIKDLTTEDWTVPL
ncbi:type II toxin-antitoxin system VapC family toxin [Argonema galeatum]|uniref:type II toxin-antitoxin system VapC family toxin n=1 Tax=Argonema galeatum TaxID=2942762 RepID=UPI00201121FB|nr:PIN domain-containing protein [Argonema galeatum]MCL1466491.1 PIN domain-containing protein [Argonema galeatum A003/A1]